MLPGNRIGEGLLSSYVMCSCVTCKPFRHDDGFLYSLNSHNLLICLLCRIFYCQDSLHLSFYGFLLVLISLFFPVILLSYIFNYDLAWYVYII